MKAKRKFNWKQFGADVHAMMEKSGMSMRSFAAQLNMHHATFFRAVNGKPIKVPDFVHIMAHMPKARATDYLMKDSK